MSKKSKEDNFFKNNFIPSLIFPCIIYIITKVDYLQYGVNYPILATTEDFTIKFVLMLIVTFLSITGINIIRNKNINSVLTFIFIFGISGLIYLTFGNLINIKLFNYSNILMIFVFTGATYGLNRLTKKDKPMIQGYVILAIYALLYVFYNEFYLININYSYANFTNYENHEMVVFDQNNEYSILCDFHLSEKGILVYLCNNNQAMVQNTELKFYRK